MLWCYFTPCIEWYRRLLRHNVINKSTITARNSSQIEVVKFEHKGVFTADEQNRTKLQFWTRVFQWKCSHWKSANWTDLTDTKLTQLHDALLVTRVSVTKLIGCSAHTTVLFSTVCLLWTGLHTIVCWYRPWNCLPLVAGPSRSPDPPSGTACRTTWYLPRLCQPSVNV